MMNGLALLYYRVVEESYWPCLQGRPDRGWEVVAPHPQYRHRHRRPSQYRNYRPRAQSRIQPQYLGESSQTRLGISYGTQREAVSLPAALSLRGRLPTYFSAKSPSCSARVVSRYCCLSYNAMQSSTGRLEARIITTIISCYQLSVAYR
jgi:hypothetical protein